MNILISVGINEENLVTATLRVVTECNSSELKFMNYTYWPWPVTARV
jgi:hypothetical protein